MGCGRVRRLGFVGAAVVAAAATVVTAAPTASAGSPTTTTINQGAGQSDPTAASPIVFDVVFSRIVTLFDSSDIDLSASTAGGALVANVTGSGATYTVEVTGMTTGGTVVAAIPAGAADDENGRPTPASTSIDNTVTWAPPQLTSVTINQGALQSDPTSASPIVFDVVFSRSVTLFDSSDIDLSASTAGGTLLAGVSGSGTSYTVSVTGMTTGGTVVAAIPAGAADDENGRPTTASTSIDNTVTWVGPSAPTVSIDQEGLQLDPTSTSPITFEVAFSEDVVGFDATDVDLSSSTAGGTLAAAVSGSGAAYTVTVTGMTTSGFVVATIPAGAAQNGSAVDSLASTSLDNTVTWIQPDPPSVTVNQASGQDDPTSMSPVVFEVVFSEPVTGFDESDVDLSSSTVEGTLTPTVTGSDDTYTVTVDVPAPSAVSGWRRVEAPAAGVIVVALPAGIATSVATGLPSLASTSADNTVTWTGGTSVTTTTSPTGPTTTSPTGPTTEPSGPTTTVATGPTTSTSTGGSTTTTVSSLPATGAASPSTAVIMALVAFACGAALFGLTRRRA